MTNHPLPATAKLKATLLIGFIVGVIVLFRFTPLQETINPERIKQIIIGFGPWAPAIFIVSYAAGVCLFMPALLFTGIGAVLFGPYQGFLYNEIGALTGAAIAFTIARYLGRDFSAALIGARLRRYDRAIAGNGFATVLYLRLIFFPFTPLNFGLGLTSVSFKDYFLGTMLGIMAGGFAITFFIANLAEILASRDFSRLISGKSLVALVLFGGAFFIPKLVNRFRPPVEPVH